MVVLTDFITHAFPPTMSSSAADANFLQPFPRRSCRLKSVEPTTSSFPRFSNQKSVLSGGFESLDSTSMRIAAGKRKKNRGMDPTNSMVELIKMLPLRNPEGEEDARVLEHDDYVDESSGLSPLIVDKGWKSKLNRLSKWIVAGVFAVVILCRRDGEALWAAMGSVANSELSMTLKRILNQERPNPSVRSEPGMPSSHAQSIFYIAMFTIWSIVEWLGINEITLTVGAFALAIATYLTWLRVSQHLHTLSQVLVGAAIGTTFFVLWIWLWNAFVHEAFTSSVVVRIVVASGAAAFCLGFVVNVIRNWLKDER